MATEMVRLCSYGGRIGVEQKKKYKKAAKKYRISLRVHSLQGVATTGDTDSVMVLLQWKGGSRRRGITPFRRTCPQTDRTSEKLPGPDGTVTWDQEFEYIASLAITRDGSFCPWEIHFIVIQGFQQGTNPKCFVAGHATMNLADFASPTEDGRCTTRIPASHYVGIYNNATFLVTVTIVELRTSTECYGSLRKLISPSLLCIGASPTNERNDYVVDSRTSSSSEQNVALCVKNKSGEFDQVDNETLTTSSSGRSAQSSEAMDFDDIGDEEEDGKSEGHDFSLSSCYGTLTGVNLMVEGALSYKNELYNDSSTNKIVWIHSKTTLGDITKCINENSTPKSNQGSRHTTRLKILPWKKRRLSFRSHRWERGKPLLNKQCADEGGDDIDFDRRLCWMDYNIAASILCFKFGEECFMVGRWEKKEFFSRDKHMKLSTDVFLASIDQCCEKVAGQSACATLVVLIADWLHRNPNNMPIKVEFDSLIREGSDEWRRLCENAVYRDRFPNKHFDLETVLEAKVRQLLVVPERSYIGFFQLDGVGDTCDFLQGAMSFDTIWDEIVSKTSHESFQPIVYIVGWNDHFFILKVERDVCYIIDTLGERLFEGCNQAYILRFDKETRLLYKPPIDILHEENRTSRPLGSPSTLDASSDESKTVPSPCQTITSTQSDSINVEGGSNLETKEATDRDQTLENREDTQREIVYEGMEACKQFIKGFFAALPLRELQLSINKGLATKNPLHEKLQIEFHSTLLELELRN